jgi:hypothetical protein
MYRRHFNVDGNYFVNMDTFSGLHDELEYEVCFYPKIIINLFDTKSNTKVSIIMSSQSVPIEMKLYDFKFLGATKDFGKSSNQLTLRNTIKYILNKNMEMPYQQQQNSIEPMLNVVVNNNNNNSNFQVEINISRFPSDLNTITQISDYYNIREFYVDRIKYSCMRAYKRMLKYYKRGFYTFTDANINNLEFLADIDNLDPNEFIAKHIPDTYLENLFKSQLSTVERIRLANLGFAFE